ncbi:MAG: hypothetical protein QM820_48650 [Minicystis sp.]
MRVHGFLSLVALLPLIITASACGSGGPAGGGGDGGSSASSTSSTSSGLPGYVITGCNVPSQFTCIESQIPEGAVDAEDKACNDEGNMAVGKCPSGGLIGCCTYAAGTTTCFYTGGPLDAATAELACTQGQGSWSTSH